MLTILCLIYSPDIIIETIKNILSSHLNIVNFLMQNHLLGTIPDWINFLIIVIIFPLLLREWNHTNERIRDKKLQEEKEKNQNLLSLERCAKLYSLPKLKKNILIKQKNFNLTEVSKSGNVMSSFKITDIFKRYDGLEMKLFFQEETSHITKEVYFESLEFHLLDEQNNSLTHIFNNLNQTSTFHQCFVNSLGTVTILNIIPSNSLVTNLKSCLGIRVVIKGSIKNAFGIQTNMEWNAVANKVNDTLTFSIQESLYQMQNVTDTNL